MNIGAIAQRTGLSAKTIRYYEDIGLIHPKRDFNGYRAFQETDFHKLAFLGRARTLGFTIDDCRTLMALYEDKARASADVKKVVIQHLEQIEQKLTQLQEMRATLDRLVSNCAGDDRPNCPILNDLAAQ